VSDPDIYRVEARYWQGAGLPVAVTEGDRGVAIAAVRQALEEGYREIVVEVVPDRGEQGR
jgi:hypothetical protein